MLTLGHTEEDHQSVVENVGLATDHLRAVAGTERQPWR